MGLFDRIFRTAQPQPDKAEGRSFGNALAAARATQIFHHLELAASINPENAMEVSVVAACVQKISQTVAALDVDVYSVDGMSQTRLDHELTYLLKRSPDNAITAFDFREKFVSDAYLHGRGFAAIHRTGGGRVDRLEILEANEMKEAELGDGRPAFIYQLTGDVYTEEELFVVKAFRDTSPVHLHQRSIALMKAAETYASSFFQNGGNVSGILKTPHTLTDEQFGRLRETWHGRYHGPEGAHRTAILENGTDFVKVGTNPESAQLSQARKLQAEQIALSFGVPPALLGIDTNVTYNNTEEQARHFAQYTIGPLVRRIEQEAALKLLPERERGAVEVRFNLSSLLRADAKTRGEYFTRLAGAGIVSINEAREALENLNPIEGGDTHLVPLNLAPLDSLGAEPEPAPEPPAPEAPEPEPNADELPD
jgi:HK97 family phage portal protein